MPDPLMIKNVFAWDFFNLYLSGPIDFDKFARDWRKEWTDKLVEIGFKPNQIFDPCKKPLSGAQFNLDNEGEIMQKHRSRHEWQDLCEVMSQIVHVDLRLVDKSDIVLVNFPVAGQERYKELTDDMEHAYKHLMKHLHVNLHAEWLDTIRDSYMGLLSQIAKHRVPTYGTVHEIVEARQQRKPVLVVWEGGKEACSAWIMWLVGHRNVFGSFDELLTRLENISKGKTAYNARDWLLLDLGRE